MPLNSINRGITYNSYHSYSDKGWYLVGSELSSPTPKRVLVTIPYRDHALDFSRVLDSKTHYETRDITWTFARQYATEAARTADYDAFVAWLWSIQGAWVQDDTLGTNSWLYDVCVTEVTPTINPLSNLVVLEVKATCFPYRAAGNQSPPDNLLSGWIL